MPFITFIYKIKNNPKTYYGKLSYNYISDDHEGLDTEVKYELLNGLNKYRNKLNLPSLKQKNLTVGILSFSQNNYIPTYSSKEEVKCFDFYYVHEDWSINSIIYVNGKLIE